VVREDVVTDAILEAHGIEVTLGESPILRGASLAVLKGETHVLIGPNGAGKTTLANAITGHVPITSGDVRLEGRLLKGAVYHRVRAGVGRKFQIPRVFARLTAQQNVTVADRTYNDEVIHEGAGPVVAGPVLEHRAGAPAAELSHGERQQLELEMVLTQHPFVVILDEPTAGMTRKERSELAGVIRGEAGERTFLIVEHDMDFVEAVADRVSFMQDGEVLLTGTFAEIASDARVREAYLGDGGHGAAVGSHQSGRTGAGPVGDGDGADYQADRARHDGQARTNGAAATTTAVRAESLKVRHLSVFRESLVAVRDIELDAEPGAAIGILGRNGAGKTTLLSGLCGILRTEGEIELDGERIEDRPAWWRACHGMALVPQGRGLFTDQTVLENLRLAECGPRGEGREFDVHALFPALQGLLKRRAGLLSGGEQQQVAIARALLRRPTVLLLDEPTEGLAPVIVEEIAGIVQELVAGGMTVLLAEQHRGLVELLCTHYLVLRAGETAGQGAVAPGMIERFYEVL